MRKTIILLFLFFAMRPGTIGQTYSQKAVQIIYPEVFVLNSMNNAFFADGVNKVYYEIKLPQNTLSWYYTFTAYRDKERLAAVKGQMNLLGGLTKLIDETGSTATALQVLSTPPGADYCNVYLMNTYQDANTFYKTGNTFSIYKEGTRENVTSGLIEIKSDNLTTGTMYLGFQNPSSTYLINCCLEVVAIVEEYNEVQTTADQEKGMQYGNTGWKFYEAGNYDKCLEYSLKALEFDPSLAFVKFNIALVYLIQGKPENVDTYIEAIVLAKKEENTLHWLQGALQDIKDYENKNGKLKDSEIIKSLLNDEIRNY